MSNVRPGDLAIVVRCTVPDNLHKIVLVLHEAIPVEGNVVRGPGCVVRLLGGARGLKLTKEPCLDITRENRTTCGAAR